MLVCAMRTRRAGSTKARMPGVDAQQRNLLDHKGAAAWTERSVVVVVMESAETTLRTTWR